MRAQRVGRIVETGSIAGTLSLLLAATGLFLSPTVLRGLHVRTSPGVGNILYVSHLTGAVLLIGFTVWHLVPPLYAFTRKPGQSWSAYLVSLTLLALVLLEIVTGIELYTHQYVPFSKAAAVEVHLVATFALLALVTIHAWRGIAIGLAWMRARNAALVAAVEVGKPEVALARNATLTRRAFMRLGAYTALGFALAWFIGSSAAHEIRAWRLNSVGRIPALTKENWRLRVTGLVNRPVELTFEDLRRMDDVTWEITHHCVEAWSYRDSFTGVRLSDVLARAGGVQPRGRMLVFKSPEVSRQSFASGRLYTTNFPYTPQAVQDALLAYAVGGIDLPPEHGFPVRLMTPKKWGYKACKWLTEIEVIDDLGYRGYWETQGYHNTGDYSGPIFQ